eukprot:1324865-Amorphochlora_amoeboformis.AAC.1
MEVRLGAGSFRVSPEPRHVSLAALLVSFGVLEGVEEGVGVGGGLGRGLGFVERFLESLRALFT